jgi:MFS family permease
MQDREVTVAVDAAVQRRVLTVLAASQVLAGIGMACAIAVSALVATRLSGSEAVGGSATTSLAVGAAIAAFVISRVATRAGRRPALTLGYGVGALGAAGAVASVVVGSAAALLVALLLVGWTTAAGLAARFAATDIAEPDHRARSIALVVWATTVGAVAGPNLADPVQTLAGRMGLLPTTGPYLLCAVTFLLAATATLTGLRPDPLLLARSVEAESDLPPVRGEAWAAMRSSPAALLGIGGVVISHLIMVGLMSLTPVHMDHGGATLAIVGLVISLHIAGMYALSPLFGWLADRFGRTRVLALSGALLLAAAVLSGGASPHDTAQLATGLVLLGLGWSAGLVAGSALLTDSVPLRVRASVQGISDVAMNVSGALGGIAAGIVVAAASFAALGIAAAIVVAPYVLLAIAAALRPGRASRPRPGHELPPAPGTAGGT